MLENRKYRKHLDLLRNFRTDLSKLKGIKEEVFKKCPGEPYCVGRTKCLVRDKICKAFSQNFLKHQTT